MAGQVTSTPRERYFFDTDCDSHWYMVPVSLQLQWEKLNREEDDDDGGDEFNALFSAYRIPGHPNAYTFSVPLEER